MILLLFIGYKCTVTMPSTEFQRIVRDMGVLGDTCIISVSKEGVRFSVKGDLGTGNITRKQNSTSENKDHHTLITMEEATELTFALRYLNFFTKVSILIIHSLVRDIYERSIFINLYFLYSSINLIIFIGYPSFWFCTTPFK